MTETLAWQAVDDGLGFPALCRHLAQGLPGTHAHEFYAIVYDVFEGFCLHVLNNTSSLLMAGDILALRPGDTHGYRGRRNVRIVNFLFLPEALGFLTDELRTPPGMADFFSGGLSEDRMFRRHLSLPDRERVQTFFQEMERERMDRQSGWALRSRALLPDFMVFFSRLFSARFPMRQADG